MAIKTNQLSYTINCTALHNKYEIYKVSTSAEYFKGGASVLDTPLLENNVQSVLFEHGKAFYVMMLRTNGNRERLKRVLLDSDEGNAISFEEVLPEGIEDSVILQLLFNGLGSAESQVLRFNNLTGHMYCFHPNWLVHGKQSSADVIWKVPCLEIKITANCMITLHVRSFTSELLKKRITFTKKRFEDYPQYVFSDRNTLRRKLKDDTETAFIQRQIDGTKKEIPFLDIQNIDHFRQSKMGVLQEILQQFKYKYDGIVSIELSNVAETYCITHKRKNDRIQNEAIIAFLKAQEVRIVDQVEDDYSSVFCRQLADLIESRYGVQPKIGKNLKKDSLNIVLIHNAVYYEGLNDPHNKEHDGYTVQHITFEDYNGNSAFALDTVIHELMIKRDLASQKITLFDWADCGFGKTSFGLCENINDTDRFFFMDIYPDGHFSISEQELDLFNMNEYYCSLRVFEDAKTAGETIRGIIKNEAGEINIIKDTGWFAIPEIDSIYDELSSGNTKLRGKESREIILSSCVDIRSIRLNNDVGTYYFVGEIGEGMRNSVQHAANIRKIECYDNAPDMFLDMLQLMDVCFVRNGQLTVMPFPFKYLREWISTNIKKC